MSNTIGTDTNYDIVLTPTGDVQLLTGAPAVAQNTRTAMAAQRGEQVFNTEAGMPMAATAFNGLRSAAFESAARQVIEDVAGVESVDEFSVARVGDIVEYNAAITTTDGGITLGDGGGLAIVGGGGSGGEQGEAVPVTVTPGGGGGTQGPMGPPGPVGPPGAGVSGPFLKLDKVVMQNETIPSNQNALGIFTTIAPGVVVTVEETSTLIILGNM